MKKVLFLVLFLYANAHGAKLPDDIRTLSIDDFSGGLLTAYPGDKIPLNYSPNLRNVFIDEGRIQQINGFTRVGSTNTLQKVTGIFPFIQEDGEVRFVVTDSSVALETTDFNTYVFISSALNTGVLLRCKQIRNKMWCSNGSDSVFTWDRTSKVNLDGTNGTPNVPKFKYMDYWQNRVFGLNTAADGSALSWSEVRSTAGVQIAPDHFLAWPAGNSLSVGQGDGQTGNGTWVQDGQLRVCKNRSLYTIYGTNSSSYFDRKDDSQVGCISNDSIVVLDGRSYLFGNDGIYENRQRITDDIQDEINAVQKASVRTVQNLWETQSDFSKGNFYTGSTGTVGGAVTIQSVDTFTVINNLDSTESGSSITFRSDRTSYITTFTAISAPAGLRASVGGGGEVVYSNQSNFRLVMKRDAGCSSTESKRWTITNLKTGRSILRVEPGDPAATPTWDVQDFSFSLSPQIFFDGDEIAQSSFAVKIEVFPQPGCNFFVKFPTNAAKIVLTKTTTAQFISEVSTLNSISVWGNFDSVRNTNGGQIDYFIRTATSAVNITTQTWMTISPGARISAPTINNYVQWASTIASVSTITTSNIDNVTIGHIEGAGAVNRPFAIEWGNRVYVAVATETSGNFSILYVKSKITNKNPHAWMPIYGINIRAFAKDASETFYGGSASTGVFYRLDYGTNFDGQAIESVYETPNLIMDSPYKNKYIYNYLISGERETSNSLYIGTSSEGNDFSETSLSIDGSGIFREMIEGVTNSGAKNIRLRIRHNALDKGMSVDDIRVLWKPTAVYK